MVKVTKKVGQTEMIFEAETPEDVMRLIELHDKQEAMRQGDYDDGIELSYRDDNPVKASVTVELRENGHIGISGGVIYRKIGPSFSTPKRSYPPTEIICEKNFIY